MCIGGAGSRVRVHRPSGTSAGPALPGTQWLQLQKAQQQGVRHLCTGLHAGQDCAGLRVLGAARAAGLTLLFVSPGGSRNAEDSSCPWTVPAQVMDGTAQVFPSFS